MPRKQTRREFLQQSALATAGFWVGTRNVFASKRSPNEKLNIAVIGVSGQGFWNLTQLISDEVKPLCDIVALCDVDERRIGAAREKCPKAKFHVDFRKLFDQQEKEIDAVLVATPDHTHAPATLMALHSGKHVYCEKPLTHSVEETRMVSKAAAEAGVTTQMGTQIHAGSNYRRVVEVVRSGAIGHVREVHVWVRRSWGGQNRPDQTPAVPEGLHYNLWLGPAAYRPYHPAYLPGKWRGWWDFGGGTLADMGCHHMDLPTWALDLGYPLTVEAEGPPVHPESTPPWLTVRYEYPARGEKPPVTLTWYDGGRLPRRFAMGKLPPWGDGTLFIGDKGALLADYGRYVLLPEQDFTGFQPPAPSIPDSIGHHREWVQGCKTGSPTTCNFNYAGRLTETVLLGNVAYRSGRKIEWNPDTLQIPNAPEAMRFVKPPHQPGWGL